MTLLYRLGRIVARFCFRTFGRLEVTGRECVPPYGPLIVVCNHLAATDPPVLVASIPRPLHFVGKRGLFANPVIGYILKKAHVMSMGGSGTGIDALRGLLRLLAQDKVVVVFPEGHRSSDHTLNEGLLGIVYLALKSQAPILPVGVTGTEKLRAWRMPVPLCRLRANIGQPFTLPMIEGQPNREVMRSMLDMIMDRIAYLLPEEYRGFYSSHVPPVPRKAPPAITSSSPESGSLRP